MPWGPTLVPFRYQGQYEDGETGLYYNRFRYYSPDMGMYISSDPIGLAGNNPTLYGYVQDVNMWLDLWGLNPLGLLTSSMSNPWDTNSSITSIVVPKGGIDIEMAMSPNQTKPGGWGTSTILRMLILFEIDWLLRQSLSPKSRMYKGSIFQKV